ncbi:hypothetical protein C6P40_001236 [Pichia californica]|uniref:Uncharacterized protein n=1 Tax=Pichia californica TaxID=460514 RepID=A0A9P6WQY0_9ASCO|nr:hypothetical protein C6P40_001236 [[Candida] californica]
MKEYMDYKDEKKDNNIHIVNDVEAQSTSFYNYTINEKKKLYSFLFLLSLIFISLLTLFNFSFSFSNLSFINNNNIVNTYDLSSTVILKSLEKNYAGKWLKDYTIDNQLAGTNLKMVNYTLNKFIELGLTDSYIDQYTSYISYPLENSLSLIDSSNNNSIIYKPSLIEDILDEDPNSSYNVPAFLGYAANGNITGEFIYCNYGRFEDFEKLINLGINLKGKIAIVKYGEIYRGLKIKFAQDVGMSAVLLYTDPKDDGEIIIQNGFKPYPNGFARNPSSIQRGSALFLSMTPGDPMTPGYAIKPGEKKDRIDPFNTIPKIPALPISYKEITPILQKLSGYGPKLNNWDGLIDGYNFTIGPNPNFTLNLYNKQDFNISIMNNIMGKIKGYDDSKFILIGNHDSWTPAAADPHSGSATILEIIRAFGNLLETGWKPKISIIFASWDGEEYGLIGSTEYAEYYENELKAKCIAYINTDVSTIGNILNLQSSPMLNNILLDTTKELLYPNSSITLYDHFISNMGKIGTLGSGSDYTVFLEHLGIPSVDMGFSNNLKNSSIYQYHSLYDSYYWMTKFGDPGFIYHNLMSKFMSLVILHLSDEPVLRLRTNDYAIELEKYFNDLNIPKNWLNINKEKNLIKNNSIHKLVKIINNKLELLKTKTFDFDEYLSELTELFKKWEDLSYWQRIKLIFKTKSANSILQYYERHFLDEHGLNNRPWFKHVVYASGRYTGYKGQELPGLAEAIEDNDIKDFAIRLKKFSHMLDTLIRMS